VQAAARLARTEMRADALRSLATAAGLPQVEVVPLDGGSSVGVGCARSKRVRSSLAEPGRFVGLEPALVEHSVTLTTGAPVWVSVA
jgi:hypothetical protein